MMPPLPYRGDDGKGEEYEASDEKVGDEEDEDDRAWDLEGVDEVDGVDGVDGVDRGGSG